MIIYEQLAQEFRGKEEVLSVIRAMPNQIILLLEPRALRNGRLPPFFNESRSVDSLTQLLVSWNLSALVITDMNIVPGFTSNIINSRAWCLEASIPIVEVGPGEAMQVGDYAMPNIQNPNFV